MSGSGFVLVFTQKSSAVSDVILTPSSCFLNCLILRNFLGLHVLTCGHMFHSFPYFRKLAQSRNFSLIDSFWKSPGCHRAMPANLRLKINCLCFDAWFLLFRIISQCLLLVSFKLRAWCPFHPSGIWNCHHDRSAY